MNIAGSVIVITGASSGIGRATALELAARGAHLVVAARDVAALDGLGFAVQCDVTREADVQALAHAAVAKFGRIDVWINNAGVYLVGRFEDCPADVVRRVMETNFFGVVHGARAALQQFRKQRRGILINVDSLVAAAPQPYTSIYVASKYAVRGFSASLRMELSLEKGHDVEVCTVMPASIDTPLYEHTGNYSGRKVRAMKPTNRAEVVARAIASVVEKPRRELLVGRPARPLAAWTKAMPGTFERVAPYVYDRNHFEDEPAPRSDGNLFEPDTANVGVSGGWKSPPSRVRRGVLAGLGAAVVALAIASTMRAR
jgi:NAD(P)-dependent dehydrogenase (short-subunit alcohol dehydrogenase family)